MLFIKLDCLNGHPWSCQSQPLLGSGTEAVPAGNLIISSAIFFSGDNFSKPDHFANFINLKFISRSCMTKHQKDFLFPAVHEACTTSSIHCWEVWKAHLLPLPMMKDVTAQATLQSIALMLPWAYHWENHRFRDHFCEWRIKLECDGGRRTLGRRTLIRGRPWTDS